MAGLVKLSPLNIGDVLEGGPAMRQQAIAALAERGLDWPEHLLRGIICEYAHNAAFQRAGMQYSTTAMWGTYDRIVNNQQQDDKCAMWQERDGVMKLADTHTCSTRELHDWAKQGAADVIIHSFSQTAPDQDSFTYHGAVSFKKLSAAGLFRNSQYNSTLFFDRAYALKTCAAT